MKLSFLVIMVCSGCCMSLPSTIIPTSTRNSSNLSKKTSSLANITASPLATRAKVSENAITTKSMSTSSTSISGITASGAGTGTSKSNTDNNNSYGSNSSTSASSSSSSSSYSAGASTIAYKKIQLEQVQVTSPSPLSSKETRESPPSKIRPQIKLHINYTSVGETGVRLPEGASAALAKPTKYHYYPHNQHMYLLPECAVQQVCNAVYVRLNFTQPLCACPGYRDPCSASLDADDHHTTELVTDPHTRALTLVKTCEPVAEMRECRMPRDWSLLALQNVRTGKSHYLVICKCPETNILEGPMSHDQPTYASVPGISVFGMMCVQGARKGRPLRQTRNLLGIETIEDNFKNDKTTFPWHRVPELIKSANWN